MSVVTDTELDDLEGAAQARDEARFARTVKAVAWQSRRPDEILKAVRFAIEAGAYLTARELSELGARLFPGDAALRNAAQVLAPPRVVGSRPADDPGLRANRDWLKAHWDEYKGKWVGLKSGVLVGVADSFDELRTRGLLARDILVTRVF